MIDWDDAFANMAHIPDSDGLPEQWMADAAAFRDSGVRIQEHRYGDAPRALLDVVMPGGQPKGLAVFVHGGYWIATDKATWTHYAAGARALGWAVCLPQYTLAPESRISAITQQIGKAIEYASEIIDGPICLAGHSAGGHLASRMVCEDTPLSIHTMERVTHCLSISGLHDLRPLTKTRMNAQLQLSDDEATQESTALASPHPHARLTAWVGRDERPEFIRQAQALQASWKSHRAQVNLVIEDGKHHFSILDGLEKADSPITRAFVGLE
ncbi:alpha/beta hydrolase [Cognatiyoonia koreensis]|nr:alpha/beta hydrolase [Cognatiyoonia koreensis]